MITLPDPPYRVSSFCIAAILFNRYVFLHSNLLPDFLGPFEMALFEVLALLIIGIEDRRYWNCIPTEESRLLAARAKILGTSKDSENPCVLSGYNDVQVDT
ncbi:hypothetical protein L1987_03949 [Smallanthus sonchifolius]|uniref:Uncharacterized protein n=1 Tax=Smallanthus sonchifolius TaxID=185202 RepID=A0ACB9KC06_9ASTR|nr:hypothetical protein L1987_03949 [Smallanthus sonchifolius]